MLTNLFNLTFRIHYKVLTFCIASMCLSCNNELKNLTTVMVYTLPETGATSVEYGRDSLNKTHYNSFSDPVFLKLLRKAKPVKRLIYSQGQIPALFIYANGDSALANVSIGNKFFEVKGKVYLWADSDDAIEWAEIIYRKWYESYQDTLEYHRAAR
jgi:hypothetical protein